MSTYIVPYVAGLNRIYAIFPSSTGHFVAIGRPRREGVKGFRAMADRGEGWSKILQILRKSFMEGPLREDEVTLGWF